MQKNELGEIKKTLEYYQENAVPFAEGTLHVDFSATQNRFLSKLKRGSLILDFGCGSGRDTKYFLEQGYRVEAMDGSEKLCRLAGEYTGIRAEHRLFQELSEIERYDGIWACASILHLPTEELADVMRKMAAALKEKGMIYTSFKYGTFSGERNGRYFTDMTEATFTAFLRKIGGLEIEEQWVTFDVRPERGEERWLNVILRKR